MNDFYLRQRDVLHDIIDKAIKKQEERYGIELKTQDFNFPHREYFYVTDSGYVHLSSLVGPTDLKVNYYQDLLAWDTEVANRQAKARGKKPAKTKRIFRGQSSGSSASTHRHNASAGTITLPVRKAKAGSRAAAASNIQRSSRPSRRSKQTVVAAPALSEEASTSEVEDASETTPESSPSALSLSESPNASDASTDITDQSPYILDLDVEKKSLTGPVGDDHRNLDPRIQSNLARIDSSGRDVTDAGTTATTVPLSRDISGPSNSGLRSRPQLGIFLSSSQSQTIPPSSDSHFSSVHDYAFLQITSGQAPTGTILSLSGAHGPPAIAYAHSGSQSRDEVPRLPPLDKLEIEVIFRGQPREEASLLLQGDNASNSVVDATGALSDSTRSVSSPIEDRSTAGPSTLLVPAADTNGQAAHTPRRSTRLGGRSKPDYELANRGVSAGRPSKKRKTALEEAD